MQQKETSKKAELEVQVHLSRLWTDTLHWACPVGLCDACCAGWVGGVSCTDVHLLGQQVLALSGIGSYKSVGGHIALSVLQHWSVTGDFNNHDLFDVSGFFNCLLFDGCRWSSFVETNRFSGFVVFAVACRVLTTSSNTCNSDVCHVASLATVVSPCSIQHIFAGEL